MVFGDRVDPFSPLVVGVSCVVVAHALLPLPELIGGVVLGAVPVGRAHLPRKGDGGEVEGLGQGVLEDSCEKGSEVRIEGESEEE